MGVLEPNPPNGQRKFLGLLSLILGISVIIGIIATVASP
ncbi:SGM_5486 family transporter-associated protein [Streptomyces sp. BBFR102]